VVPQRLQEASAWLTEVGQRWDDRIDDLSRHLSLAQPGPQPRLPSDSRSPDPGGGLDPRPGRAAGNGAT
jgi:hypothetical protein